MSSLYIYIGNKIRDLRANYHGSGIRQEELAKSIGTSTNTISRWETATYKPSINDIDKLARFFGVSISIFFPDGAKDSKLKALLSASGDLKDDDIDDLIEYARYKKLRSALKTKKSRREK